MRRSIWRRGRRAWGCRQACCFPGKNALPEPGLRPGLGAFKTPLARSPPRRSPAAERAIQMYRQGRGFFWIGGPGEEAFNVPLGLLIKKGEGLDYDYLHAHYRQSATLLAMGEDPLGALRQMKNAASDPYSGGRNFVGHFSIKRWNVVPVSSPIEVQYAMAPGTALSQKRHGSDGITIVTGGEERSPERAFPNIRALDTPPGNRPPHYVLVPHQPR